MNIIERIANGAFGFFILNLAYYGMWDFAVPLFWDDAINYDPVWAIGPEYFHWMAAIFVIIVSVMLTLFGIMLVLAGLLNIELKDE